MKSHGAGAEVTSWYLTTNGVIVDEGHRAVYNQVRGGVEVVGTPKDDQRFIPAGSARTGSPFIGRKRSGVPSRLGILYGCPHGWG